MVAQAAAQAEAPTTPKRVWGDKVVFHCGLAHPLPLTPTRTETCSADSSMHSSAVGADSRRAKRRWGSWDDYWRKWRGREGPLPVMTPPPLRHSFMSLFQATLGITLIVTADRYVHREDMVFAIASFGATAVLVYSAIDSPLAQPRNVIYGHVISAIVGVSMNKLLAPYQPALAAGLSVGLAIAIMERTCCLHPPGGATALFAVIGSDRVKALGYAFVLFPCLLSSLLMLLVSLTFNNLDDTRSYPTAWTFPEVEACARAIVRLRDKLGAAAPTASPVQQRPLDSIQIA